MVVNWLRQLATERKHYGWHLKSSEERKREKAISEVWVLKAKILHGALTPYMFLQNTTKSHSPPYYDHTVKSTCCLQNFYLCRKWITASTALGPPHSSVICTWILESWLSANFTRKRTRPKIGLSGLLGLMQRYSTQKYLEDLTKILAEFNKSSFI